MSIIRWMRERSAAQELERLAAMRRQGYAVGDDEIAPLLQAVGTYGQCSPCRWESLIKKHVNLPAVEVEETGRFPMPAIMPVVEPEPVALPVVDPVAPPIAVPDWPTRQTVKQPAQVAINRD